MAVPLPQAAQEEWVVPLRLPILPSLTLLAGLLLELLVALPILVVAAMAVAQVEQTVVLVVPES